MSKILITAALPYANGPLHFGHIAGAYLPADCYARFQRLKQNDVLYICGSDEYGVAITMSAEMAGRSPKEHVDLFHEMNRAFFKQMNISFDHFSRTTWEGHVPETQRFFKDLLKNGYIEEKVTDQLFSEQDQKFLADRYVVGTCPKCGFQEARGDECQKCGASYEATDLIQPRSKISNAPLVLKKTRHWFMRFDLFKDKLAEWIAEKNWKPNVIHFARRYIEELKARAITRDSSWGIPVPLKEAEGKVFYVWFDAPIGYISATQEWAQEKRTPDAWKEYWLDPDTKLIQFVGKDNIPFHAVFFPAMCMGQNMPFKLVDELPANEFYNLEGRQFSKSEGWTIDLERFFKQFTVDQIRYAIAANAPETQDSEFSWKDFQMRCNSELLGKYGNLANRTLVFAALHCASKVPNGEKLEQIDKDFLNQIQQIAKNAELAFETFHLRKAAQCVMELAQAGNVYFDTKKPWITAKHDQLRHEMQTAIYCCLECLKTLAIISFPIIPETAEKLWKMLGFSYPLSSKSWDNLIHSKIPSGQVLPKPHILFQKIEDEVIMQEIDKLKALGEKPEENVAENPYLPLQPEITIDEVKKLDLRVAQIIEAERIPKSKKLLKLTVNLGFEKRTIVSGIGSSFEDLNALLGKKIVVIANLKPSKLMGVESQGMLLAADLKDIVELPELQAALPGSVVR